MFIRRSPWSLLRTPWLNVPIGTDPVHAGLTWRAFSEVFEGCLRDVARHVGRRVDDRSSLEGIVTAVLVDNLDILVSSLGEQERLGRLLTAADLLIARRASAERGQTDARERGDRGAKVSHRAGDT